MNIQHLLKQAQQMQSSVMKIEKELKEKHYTASSGGDAVKVTVSGEFQIVDININEELLEKESKEMLQDMILMTVNNALVEAQKDKEEQLGQVTQGVKMPGTF